MKKANKKLLYISAAIIVLMVSILPAFAYQPQNYNITYVNTDIANTTSSFSIPNDIANVSYIQIRMTDSINIYAGTNENNIELVFVMPVYHEQYFNISVYASGDDGFSGMIGYGDNVETYLDGNVSPDSTHKDININIVCYLPTTITYEDYKQANDANYLAGIQFVQNNPLLYNLYTEQERNSYGQSQYALGRKNGIAEAGEADYNRGYTNGLMQGHKDAATIKGIANVALTGVYNVFTYVTQNTSIFGISLIAVIVSGVIIITIFLIFKLERS